MTISWRLKYLLKNIGVGYDNMLPGIIIKPLRRHVDERGFFMELMRADWKDVLGEDKIVQANLSITYPGIVRA